jgi:hypothetical protein
MCIGPSIGPVTQRPYSMDKPTTHALDQSGVTPVRLFIEHVFGTVNVCMRD